LILKLLRQIGGGLIILLRNNTVTGNHCESDEQERKSSLHLWALYFITIVLHPGISDY
jgi:hypothetical protein